LLRFLQGPVHVFAGGSRALALLSLRVGPVLENAFVFSPVMAPSAAPPRLAITWPVAFANEDPTSDVLETPLPGLAGGLALTFNGQGVGANVTVLMPAGVQAPTPLAMGTASIAAVVPVPPLTVPVPLVPGAVLLSVSLATVNGRSIPFPMWLALGGTVDCSRNDSVGVICPSASSSSGAAPPVVLVCSAGPAPSTAVCARPHNDSRPVLLPGPAPVTLSFSFNGRDFLPAPAGSAAVPTMSVEARFVGPAVVVSSSAAVLGDGAQAPALVTTQDGSPAEVVVSVSGLTAPNATVWFGDPAGGGAVSAPVLRTHLLTRGTYEFAAAVPVNVWCDPSATACSVPVCVAVGSQLVFLARPFTYISNVGSWFPQLPFPLRGPQALRFEPGVSLCCVPCAPSERAHATPLHLLPAARTGHALDPAVLPLQLLRLLMPLMLRVWLCAWWRLPAQAPRWR
jgi:hypothetical protein